MTGLELTGIEPGEVGDFFDTGEVPFGDRPHQVDKDYWASLLELERALVVRDRGRIVAVTAALTMDVSVPGGGHVPMAGVTLVGVLPTHRRRGLAARLLAAVHDDARGRGEPLAGLWASESRIYGRFGYGTATRTARHTVATARAGYRDAADPRGRVRLVEPAEGVDLMLALHERERARTPGMVCRTEARVRGHLTRDPEHWREGAGARFLAAVDDRALTAYRVEQRWQQAGPAHRLHVSELYAGDDEAYALLWRYLLELDLVAEVRAVGRPVDEPLGHLLEDPRRLRTTTSDGLWLRLLDPAAVLAARRYDVDGSFVLEVVDPAGPAAGRWALAVDGGAGSCTPSSASPDATLPVDSLAAACLGGTSVRSLARAGRAAEHTDGALRRLDLTLSSDPQPWCPFEF